MKKRALIIGAAVVILCVVVVLGVLLGSAPQGTFEQALKNAGISVEDVYVYKHVNMDMEGRYCKVIQSTMTETGTPVLAIVSQLEDGGWEVTKNEEAANGFADMGWFGIQQYTLYESQTYFAGGMLTSDHTWNFVYYGNNARKKIELDDADIPNNVAVSVEQENNEYWIYVVSYSDSADSGFNIYGLLQEGSFIRKS